MKSPSCTNRHRFRKQTAAVTGVSAASQVFRVPNILSARSPNERMNVNGIGVVGQGFGDLRNVAVMENTVALADVDSARAENTFTTGDKATRYTDFRRILDKEDKNIDAVVFATPDRMRASAALACLSHFGVLPC